MCGTRSNEKLVGGYSVGDTPVPIPNTAVKPHSADGTAGEARWESTSSPAFLVRPPSYGPRAVTTGVVLRSGVACGLGVVANAALLRRRTGAFAAPHGFLTTPEATKFIG
jgi:hypothetical protein